MSDSRGLDATAPSTDLDGSDSGGGGPKVRQDSSDGPWGGKPVWLEEVDQEIIDRCDELAMLLIAKCADYGPDAIDKSPWGWGVAIITRLHEKLARLIHMEKLNDDFTFENLAESYKDLAGLAVLGWQRALDEM